MLIRAGIFVGDRALLERVRRAVASGTGELAPLPGGPDRRRFESVVVTRLDPGELLDELRREPQDLVIADLASVGRDEIPSLCEELSALIERTGMILLHPDDDPRAHAALLAAGCVAVLWTGLSDAGLAEALAALFDRRRDESIARRIAARPERERPESLVAASPPMQELLATVRRVALADTPVLLLGETGVGKERIAALLHAWGPRSRGPFVALNCAAIPAELFESELFGHERGAFTGALRARRGHFELAHGGTLFLDEIGEIPLPLQAKLLRVLQDRRIRPLGGDRELSVDVRVLAATNRDLRAELEHGSFRRDLYYRLGVVELEVPPLRERAGDIRELTQRYAVSFAERLGRPVLPIDEAALRALEGYAWPGNVRELINVVERVVLLSTGDSLTLEDLPPNIVGPAPAGPASPHPAPVSASSTTAELGLELSPAWFTRPWRQLRELLLREGERAYLVGLLRAHAGRIGVSARAAGMAERSLFEKMKRHGLRKEDFREPEG